MRSSLDLLRRVVRGLPALLTLLALSAPSAALASGDDVWADCGDQDGAITKPHSQADYNDALKNPPADGAEYSNCISLIRQAQIRASQKGSGSAAAAGGAGAGGGGSTGGGASAVAPAALTKALRSSGIDPVAATDTSKSPAAPAPVTVDGKRIDLASGGTPSIASALSLPLPLALAAIVVLLSATLPLARWFAARSAGPPTAS